MHSPLNPNADLSRPAPRPVRLRAGRTTSHGPATPALLRRGSPGAPAEPPIAGGGADPSSDLPTMRRDATHPPGTVPPSWGGGVPPVMGGQGRDASDVVINAVAAVVCLLALALVVVGVL